MRTAICLLLLAFIAGAVCDAIPLAVAEAEAKAEPHPIAWPYPLADEGGEEGGDGGGEEESGGDDSSGGGGLLGLGAILQVLLKPLLDLLVSLGINIG